jgi:glycosyltransferase involved in cell wall biosynthesis
MARRMLDLLSNHALRRSMGERAAQTAKRQFDLETQIDAYLEWYGQMAPSRNAETVAHAC